LLRSRIHGAIPPCRRGIARNETTRRVFEDTFVADLRAAGVQVQPAYTQIEAGENGKVKLTDLVRASGADAGSSCMKGKGYTVG
jgi:hypothetical protein